MLEHAGKALKAQAGIWGLLRSWDHKMSELEEKKKKDLCKLLVRPFGFTRRETDTEAREELAGLVAPQGYLSPCALCKIKVEALISSSPPRCMGRRCSGTRGQEPAEGLTPR